MSYSFANVFRPKVTEVADRFLVDSKSGEAVHRFYESQHALAEQITRADNFTELTVKKEKLTALRCTHCNASLKENQCTCEYCGTHHIIQHGYATVINTEGTHDTRYTGEQTGRTML